jgi:two-component system OmpR family response regulator/two-component system response regulator QseB
MNAVSTKTQRERSAAVLLIEDERPTSEGLEAELTMRGFAVELARTAAEATRRLGEYPYSAVVLDLIIPDGGPPGATPEGARKPSSWPGVALLRCIRSGQFAERGVAAKLPVFVLTCVLAQDTQEELNSLGYQEFWSKPTKPAIVAEGIKLFLQGKAET